MAHIKFQQDGGRAIWFSKNRRGGQMDKLFFSLNQKNHVGWFIYRAIKYGNITFNYLL